MAVRHEAPRKPIEEAGADRGCEALGLLQIGVPFAFAMRCHEAVFGHGWQIMPRVVLSSDSRRVARKVFAAFTEVLIC